MEKDLRPFCNEKHPAPVVPQSLLDFLNNLFFRGSIRNIAEEETRRM